MKNQTAYYLLRGVMPLFVKLSPQTITFYIRESLTKVNITVVQDDTGIWNVSGEASFKSIRHQWNNFGYDQNLKPDASWTRKVCSCQKDYIMCIQDQSINDSHLYLKNFSLPLVAEQPVQSTCQYHNHSN